MGGPTSPPASAVPAESWHHLETLRAAAASVGTNLGLLESRMYLLHFEYVEAPISNIEDQKRHGEDNSGILVNNVDILDAGHGRF